MANVAPPAEIDPLRSGPEFDVTVNARVAGPLPDLGDTVIQLTVVDAVQGHPATAESAMVPDPPLAATRVAPGVTLKSHAAAS